jgi:hypothetical protein
MIFLYHEDNRTDWHYEFDNEDSDRQVFGCLKKWSDGVWYLVIDTDSCGLNQQELTEILAAITKLNNGEEL